MAGLLRVRDDRQAVGTRGKLIGLIYPHFSFAETAPRASVWVSQCMEKGFFGPESLLLHSQPLVPMAL